MLGVPMAAEKKEGQTTTLVFLGIRLDTVAGELWLLEQWRTKKVCRLKELESLIGLLNHACKVVRPSTQRTYGAAMRRFYAFCTHFNITSPFPVMEHLQCCFAAFLADQGLTPQTVKGYLAAVRNVQVSLGLPDPRDQSSLPMLPIMWGEVAVDNREHPAMTRIPIVSVLRKPQQQQWLVWRTPPFRLLGVGRVAAYLQYVRMPSEQLTRLSAVLARSADMYMYIVDALTHSDLTFPSNICCSGSFSVTYRSNLPLQNALGGAHTAPLGGCRQAPISTSYHPLLPSKPITGSPHLSHQGFWGSQAEATPPQASLGCWPHASPVCQTLGDR